MSETSSPSAILLVSCPDGPGILSAITGFISEHNGNILELKEHVEPQEEVFLMRLEWDLEPFDLPRKKIGDAFRSVAESFSMDWSLHFSDDVPRMAIFASHASHCLSDLLSRVEAGEWNVSIPVIISNHETLRPIAERHGIAYHHMPINDENKREQEQKQIRILRENNVNVIVLARYMQILTEPFVDHYRNQIINIHHSFLPAFPGANPYQSAYERGVKIIGATSHYVTEELDAGPIIQQDVVPVSHEDHVSDLKRKGEDLEKIVLARAVRNHLQHRVLEYDGRTAVFD
jgi:formyltetrahydrofolate deformylase